MVLCEDSEFVIVKASLMLTGLIKFKRGIGSCVSLRQTKEVYDVLEYKML